MASPIEQFKIEKFVDVDLGAVDASFTNSSLFMVLAVGLIAAFLIGATRQKQVVPGRWQSMAESGTK